jgi:hypothetical protein
MRAAALCAVLLLTACVAAPHRRGKSLSIPEAHHCPPADGVVVGEDGHLAPLGQGVLPQF